MNEEEQNDPKSAVTYLHRRLLELQGRIARLEQIDRNAVSIQKRILPYMMEGTVFDRNGTPLAIGDLVGFENETDLLTIEDIGSAYIYFIGGHTTRVSNSDDLLLIKRLK